MGVRGAPCTGGVTASVLSIGPVTIALSEEGRPKAVGVLCFWCIRQTDGADEAADLT